MTVLGSDLTDVERNRPAGDVRPVGATIDGGVPGGRAGAEKRPPYVRYIGGLTVATFLQWLGAGAVLPLLPIYLRRHGNSDAMVGAVMAAFFAAGVIAQYVGGRLGDRIGHKRVLLLGLVGYAVASAGFLLPLNGLGYVALRAGQGAAAGAAQVAMLALVTQAVPLRLRGRAISAVYGGELGGVAVGPLVGSLIGVPQMAALFLVASAAALLAGLPVLASRTHRHDEGDDEDGVLGSGGAQTAGRGQADGGPAAGERADVGPAAGERAAGERAAGERADVGPAAGERAPGERAPGERAPGERARLPWSGPAGRVLIGVMLSAIAGGVLTGIYESCWTLLLDFRHAQPWQIGASWTLFALPFVFGAPVAGWVADHYDRRVLVVVAMVVSVGFALLYPWVTDVSWLIGLSAAESLGVAFAVPAAQSMLGQATPGEQIGQAQGLFASIQTAAIAVTAGVSGALFSLGPWWPFTVGAVVALAITAALPWVWRGVPGRAGERIEARVS